MPTALVFRWARGELSQTGTWHVADRVGVATKIIGRRTIKFGGGSVPANSAPCENTACM